MRPLRKKLLLPPPVTGRGPDAKPSMVLTKGDCVLEAGAGNSGDQPLQKKAVTAVIEELQRQAEENPDALRVSSKEACVHVDGEIDVDALVMVVVGAMAGGP